MVRDLYCCCGCGRDVELGLGDQNHEAEVTSGAAEDLPSERMFSELADELERIVDAFASQEHPLNSLPGIQHASEELNEEEEFASSMNAGDSSGKSISHTKVRPAANHDASDARWAALCAFFAAAASFANYANHISLLDGAVLFVLGLLLWCMSLALGSSARRERLSAARRIVRDLRGMTTADLPAIHNQNSRFPPRPGDDETRTATYTNKKDWRMIPNNLLKVGDVVLLAMGTRAPADLVAVNSSTFEAGSPSLVIRRDHFVPQASSSLLPSIPQSGEVSSASMELFGMRTWRVLATPLSRDLKRFLLTADEAQMTFFGYSLRRVTLTLRIVGITCAVIFGLVLGGVRFASNRSDAQGWAELFLLRPAALIVLMPPLSMPMMRAVMETYFTTKILKSVEIEAGFWSTLWRWLVPRMQCDIESSEDLFHFPLLPSTLLRTAGSVTALCALNEDVLINPEAAVEEVFFLKGEGRYKVVDCCPEPSVIYNLRFEESDWISHLSSLKPLGLCSALASINLPPLMVSPSSSSNLLDLMYARSFSPHVLNALSSAMGFRESDLAGFVVRGRVVFLLKSSGAPIAKLTRGESWSNFHGRVMMECLIVEPPVWQRLATAQQHITINDYAIQGNISTPEVTNVLAPTPRVLPLDLSSAGNIPRVIAPGVNSTEASNSPNHAMYAKPAFPASGALPHGQPTVFSTGSLHLICLGGTKILAPMCNEYWDGESIWPLDADSRAHALEMSDRWNKEDFDCSFCAYAPLSGVHSVAVGAALQQTLPTNPFVAVVSQTEEGSPTLVPTPMLDQSAGSLARMTASPLALTTSLCAALSRGLIFTGMVGARDQPRLEVPFLVADCHRAGVRFVYFSPRDPRRSRIVASKMGLETDWNTSISLQESRELHDPLLEPVPAVDWELKAKMPRGVSAIRTHIETLDDVPLRVSLLTDCSPRTSKDMIDVVRDWEEVTCALLTTRGGAYLKASIASNVSLGFHDMDETSNRIDVLSSRIGALSCVAVLPADASRRDAIHFLGTGRVSYFNYTQANLAFAAGCLIAMSAQCVVMCLSAPPLWTVGHAMWITLVQAPLASLPVAARSRSRTKTLKMRMPWKRSAAPADNYFLTRFAAYACVRLGPVAALVVVIFCWSLGFNHLAYQTDFASVNGTSALWTPREVVGAQSAALLTLVWGTLCVSATLASRTEWRMEFKFWRTWFIVTVFSIGLQLAYNCAYAQASAAGSCDAAWTIFEGYGAWPWAIVAVVPPVAVVLFGYPAKQHDKRIFSRAMKLLRLDFETKLGQFSPR